MYGRRGAPLKIDLVTGRVRLRTHSAVLEWTVRSQKLRGLRDEVYRAKRLAEERREETGRAKAEPPVTFVAHVPTHCEYLIIAAERRLAPKREAKRSRLLVVAVDVNSRFGFTVVVATLWRLDSILRVKVHQLTRLKPPSHRGRRCMAAKLQCLATSLEVSVPLERRRAYFEEAMRARARERSVNEGFRRKFLVFVRRWLRWGVERSYLCVVAADIPDYESLRGTRLSGTLLGITGDLENLAKYEGADFRLLRASGKFCPLCGCRAREEEERKKAMQVQLRCRV